MSLAFVFLGLFVFFIKIGCVIGCIQITTFRPVANAILQGGTGGGMTPQCQLDGCGTLICMKLQEHWSWCREFSILRLQWFFFNIFYKALAIVLPKSFEHAQEIKLPRHISQHSYSEHSKVEVCVVTMNQYWGCKASVNTVIKSDKEWTQTKNQKNFYRIQRIWRKIERRNKTEGFQ